MHTVLNAWMAAMCSIEEMEVQVFPKLGTVHSSETRSTNSTHWRTSVHSQTVLLRGTAEQFGVHILVQLLQTQNMVKVYALNREKSGLNAALAATQRQWEQF